MKRKFLALILLFALGGILLTGCSSEKSYTNAPAIDQQYQGRGGCATGSSPQIINDAPLEHIAASESTSGAV